MLFSHVKRSPLLWLHNKQRLSQQKNHFTEMVWHLIGVYIINRTLHGRLEIRNFSSRVAKYFTCSLRSPVKNFLTREENFRISARLCNILYVFDTNTAKLPPQLFSDNSHPPSPPSLQGKKTIKPAWHVTRKNFAISLSIKSKYNPSVALFRLFYKPKRQISPPFHILQLAESPPFKTPRT